MKIVFRLYILYADHTYLLLFFFFGTITFSLNFLNLFFTSLIFILNYDYKKKLIRVCVFILVYKIIHNIIYICRYTLFKFVVYEHYILYVLNYITRMESITINLIFFII